MKFDIKNIFVKISAAIIFYLLFLSSGLAQHRGDNLSFQGLANQNELGVRATAMGGAFTSIGSDLSSIFYNPAGLTGISSLQVSVSGNYYQKDWRENQDYRPNRFFVTLPFYLEGFYIPRPEDNGKWDHELAKDTSYFYQVSSPKLGLDPFSEEAADWKKKEDNFSFNNIAAAYPFVLSDLHFVAAAAYNQKYNVLDYDRNDTYLTPHPGDRRYGDLERVDGLDTMVVNWSVFTRNRSGKINSFKAALAFEPVKNISVGAGMDFIWGSVDEYQNLNRVGSFDLIRENRFRFYYQDVFSETAGTSDFSGSKINLGALLKLNRLSIGVNVDLPYTIKREWSCLEIYSDSVSSYQNQLNGTDEFNFPLIFNIGVSFRPADKLIIAFDYEAANFSKAEANLALNDTTFEKWLDRNSLRFGIEYSPFDFLSLQAGYKEVPEVYCPDGAAITSRGPNSTSYTAGLSFRMFFGRIDVAYELRKFSYYDSYFSNTNYVTENYSNLLFGYTFSF